MHENKDYPEGEKQLLETEKHESGRKHSEGKSEPRAMVLYKKPAKSQFSFSSSTLLSVLKVRIYTHFRWYLQGSHIQIIFFIYFIHFLEKRTKLNFLGHMHIMWKILFSRSFIKEKLFFLITFFFFKLLRQRYFGSVIFIFIFFYWEEAMS